MPLETAGQGQGGGAEHGQGAQGRNPGTSQKCVAGRRQPAGVAAHRLVDEDLGGGGSQILPSGRGGTAYGRPHQSENPSRVESPENLLRGAGEINGEARHQICEEAESQRRDRQ